MEIGQEFYASYWTSVYKPAIRDWRSEYVRAKLVAVSKGKARVIEAEMSEARSKRQRYWVEKAEQNEIGKIKIISKLSILEMIE